MHRDGLSKADALARITSQMSLKEKMNMASILIENNGSKDDLKHKVDVVVRELESKWTPQFIRSTTYLIIFICLWFAFKAILIVYYWIVD
ncbi:hypothetical protein DICVIV_06095 [Dictyocaulus viviparus]|uniref:Dephospho-CoA kinase n=1 Tax=Dictyocaulus viviparus TaxID=29172 RepID=A0A0D8XT67_DICVI|nr:hypothetical protein DICVIV_06095 [Dictyocaulus viviparus]